MTDEMRLKAAWLASIETGERVLLPKAVVDAARPEDSPGHRFFEWDDSVAAEEYRIEQARRLIRSVPFVVQTTKHELKTPHYVHVTSQGQREGYQAIDIVRQREESRREVFNDEVKRLLAGAERARDVAAALGMGDEIEAVLASLARLQERLAAA